METVTVSTKFQVVIPETIRNHLEIHPGEKVVMLEKNGVENRPLFSCIPNQQPSYEYLKKRYEGELQNAEYVGRNGFYIGCHQYLSDDDIHYIINVFNLVLDDLT